MRINWISFFLLFSFCTSYASKIGDLDYIKDYSQNDTLKISKIGNVLEVKSLFTFPSSERENQYYLTIQPKYKFGDFSLIASATGNRNDGHTTIEVSAAHFVPWTVRMEGGEERNMLIVPDNKPLDNLDVAYGGLQEYFPYQYLKPLLKKRKLQFDLFKENSKERHEGLMSFKLEEYTSLKMNYNDILIDIPCIKITQSVEIEFKSFKNQKEKVIKYLRKRTYWILNNINDPIILKNEGYRSNVLEGSNFSINNFKYLENSQIVSIKAN